MRQDAGEGFDEVRSRVKWGLFLTIPSWDATRLEKYARGLTSRSERNANPP
jgi:hypothetical protein